MMIPVRLALSLGVLTWAATVIASPIPDVFSKSLALPSQNPTKEKSTWVYPKWNGRTIGLAHPTGGMPLSIPAWSDTALLRIASLRGLAALHRDVALLCQESRVHSDAHNAIPDCEVAMVDLSGQVFPIGRSKVIGVQRLPGNRILLLTRDLKLLIRDSLGSETLIGESVAVPRVSEDGQQIVFTQFPKGTIQLVPGLVGKLTRFHVASGESRIVTHDPTASSPIPVPGTDEVLFLSARTGLASVWVASPGKPDRQITNLGLTQMGLGFIPVYGQEWVWVPASRHIVFTASYGSQSIWQLDIDSGKSKRLGSGKLPQWKGGGVILAIDPERKSASGVKLLQLERQK